MIRAGTQGDFYVVSYDIPNDHRRARLATLLLGFGFRIQESVYECVLDGKQFKQLDGRLKALVRPTEDAVRIYRLCATCRKSTAAIGGQEPHDHTVYVL